MPGRASGDQIGEHLAQPGERREVDVGVVEAGLGGRYDATNVISSEVQALTGVGLEHTRWLGPTIADIAREKLDVVQDGGTLVLGHGLHPDAEAEAESIASAIRRHSSKLDADHPGDYRGRDHPILVLEPIGRLS